MTARAIVLSGYGLNCEAETKLAFELAGATADIVHINDLIAAPEGLRQYQIMALPGGFSFGDDTGSGRAFALRLRHHLEEPLQQFGQADRLMIGICNGFQIMANLGLLPVALTANSGGRYLDRWVDVRVDSASPWLAGLETLAMPIAHGEGRVFASDATLTELRAQGRVALRYVAGDMCSYQDLPANPNGSLEDIAGLTDTSGRILGLMPHPERAMFFTQQPNWPVVAESRRRAGQPLPEHGPGLQLFANAVRYFGA